MNKGLTGLDETNSGSLFAKALTAEVEAVFADETSLMRAKTALTATLAKFAWSREPNRIVRHFVV